MIALALATALAQEPAPPETPTTSEEPARRWDMTPHDLRNTQAGFLAGEFVGSVVLGFAGPDLVFSNPPASEEITCDPEADPRVRGWCNPPGFDETVIRLVLAPPGARKGVGYASHGFTMVAAPLLAFSGVIAPAVLTHHGQYGLQDSLIILDAWALSTGFNSLAKIGGQRQRPGFHYDREDLTEAWDHPNEAFVSFYSGDTTWAFTFASSATTLAYLRGYPHAKALGITLGSVALVGGVLRSSADMHWPTDVLTGALTGTIIGAGLPLALHGRVASDKAALVPLTHPSGARGLRVIVAF